MEKQYEELYNTALSACDNAYSPYSDFCVGAALLCSDGSIFVGSNIENASFGATVCAERSAFCSAVSKGKRDFSAIAIAGKKRGEAPVCCPPCGVCRQVISEFCRKDFKIIILGKDGKLSSYSLSELLPESFDNKEKFL